MLFKTIEEIRELLPVSKNVELLKIKPALQLAEDNFIRSVLGKNMFEELEEFYNDLPQGPLTEVQESMLKLLQLTQTAIIHLAYYSGFDFLNAHVDNSGFQRTESNTTKSLFKYQEDNLKEYFKNAGFNGLDSLLEYLEDNKQHFSEFTQSETYKKLKGNFISDTRTFNELYFIGDSRLTFMRLLPYMRIIEDLTIKTIIGPENYELIKSEMIKDAPETRVKAILPEIQKPIAFLAVAMLMEDSGADLTDKGLFFEGTMSNQNNNQIKQPADKDRITSLVRRARSLGESYIVLLKNYLIENGTAWGGFTAPASGLHNRDNEGKRTFFA